MTTRSTLDRWICEECGRLATDGIVVPQRHADGEVYPPQPAVFAWCHHHEKKVRQLSGRPIPREARILNWRGHLNEAVFTWIGLLTAIAVFVLLANNAVKSAV